MKKYLNYLFWGIIIIILLIIIIKNIMIIIKPQQNDESEKEVININKNTVSYNSWLHTDGCQLKNSKNELVQLRGVSSHSIEEYYDCLTYDNLEYMKNNWHINVFRIAMYTDLYGKGYINNKEYNTEKVCEIIDNAIKLDMYVIVDWHILNDNNPQIHENEARLFFDNISSKYSDVPNVIYEICNEPNGQDVTWDKNIKKYAEDIISIIRNNSKNSLIIVGTANWCKSLMAPADDPLNYDNIVYACHFYSGSHKKELRDILDYCIGKNIPVFISECGVTDASGNGELYTEEFDKWIEYINSNKLSWIYWSFSNKNESSAILKPNTLVPEDDNLTDAGNYIKNIFIKY